MTTRQLGACLLAGAVALSTRDPAFMVFAGALVVVVAAAAWATGRGQS